MREYLTLTLYNTFPGLYHQHIMDTLETGKLCDFSCGDGWYDIIFRLSQTLDDLIKKEVAKDPGVLRLYYASQVKEKLATLRFYMRKSTVEMEEAIVEARMESARTCERCGGEGKLVPGRWIKTFCDGCAVQWRREREERWSRMWREDSAVSGV